MDGSSAVHFNRDDDFAVVNIYAKQLYAFTADTTALLDPVSAILHYDITLFYSAEPSVAIHNPISSHSSAHLFSPGLSYP